MSSLSHLLKKILSLSFIEQLTLNQKPLILSAPPYETLIFNHSYLPELLFAQIS
jgi:hypothetical protein